MKLVKYEILKVLKFPGIWVFLSLCIVFNLLLIFGDGNDSMFFNDVSESIENPRINRNFENHVENLRDLEVKSFILEDISLANNNFEDYDTSILAGFYKNIMDSSPISSKLVDCKYVLLQSRVNNISKSSAPMDYYIGSFSQNIHQQLFGTVVKSIVFQGIIVSVFVTLFLINFDDLYNTRNLISTTFVGRNIIKSKVWASVLVSIGMYLLLSIITLGLFFLKWDL